MNKPFSAATIESKPPALSRLAMLSAAARVLTAATWMRKTAGAGATRVESGLGPAGNDSVAARVPESPAAATGGVAAGGGGAAAGLAESAVATLAADSAR